MYVCMYLMIGKGQIAQKDHIGAEIDLRTKFVGKYVLTLSKSRCNHVIIEFRQLIVRRGFILKNMLTTMIWRDDVIRKRLKVLTVAFYICINIFEFNTSYEINSKDIEPGAVVRRE